MMNALFILGLLGVIQNVLAFKGASTQSPQRRLSRNFQTKMAIANEDLPGVLSPLGYFDPLGKSSSNNFNTRLVVNQFISL